jgi:GDP-4-dehydro-6-deoxy-D-mannose reductase
MNKDQLPILVTGGTGFVGSHLVEALFAEGYQNIHVTSYAGDAGALANLFSAEQISSHIHKIDLSNAQQVAELIGELQPQHIYHLAAHASVATSFEQGQLVLENNLKLQLALLEAVRHRAPSARVLIVGSGMEYDVLGSSNTGQTPSHPITELNPLGPISPYAVSKVMQDLLGLSYAYSYKLDIIRVRPFNHIGERQTTDFAVPSFAKQIVDIERGLQQEIKVGNLDATRDFTDVKDVARAYILLMEKGLSPEVYNIGSGQGHAMHEILDMLRRLSKVEVRVVTDPNKVRPLDVPSIIADISKVRKLGWQPEIALEDTLRRILEEWRQKDAATP